MTSRVGTAEWLTRLQIYRTSDRDARSVKLGTRMMIGRRRSSGTVCVCCRGCQYVTTQRLLTQTTLKLRFHIREWISFDNKSFIRILHVFLF